MFKDDLTGQTFSCDHTTDNSICKKCLGGAALNAFGLTEFQMKAMITRVVKKVNRQQKKLVDEYRKSKEH